MKEKDFQSKFGKWLKDNWQSSAVFELKLEKGKSFSFYKVKPHQVRALKQVEKGLYHKINDLPVYSGSLTRFASRKPFDCFYLKGEYAYIVIGFYEKQKKIEALFIDIDSFCEAKRKTIKKSLKKDAWKQYARRIELI